MDGSSAGECPRSRRTGPQSHRRGGSSFYASFLQRILNRKLTEQLNQASDVTAVSPSTEELPTLKVHTLNSDQQGIVLPPIAKRGLPAPKPHHRDHSPSEKVRWRGHQQPSPSQKAVHPVQLQMECVGGSQSSGGSAWDDYDFTPVYIWVPKQQRQQSKSARQEPMDPKMKTTYLNEAIVLPGAAGDKKKKKRRKPPTRSPSARWYGDLLSEYYSDLIDLTDEQWGEILAGTGLREIIGSRASHSRTEQRRNVSDSRVASKMTVTADEPSAAPALQTEAKEEKEMEGSQSEGKDKTPLQVPESDGITTGEGPLQEENGHSKEDGLLKEPFPPQGSSQEPMNENQSELNVAAHKSLPRPPENISRYPYGNPSQPRMPRTQSVPFYPMSLQSTASYSTTRLLKGAHNVSMQSADMIHVRTCELSPRTSKEHCLPPLIKPSTRTPPPTASRPIRLSDTIL